MDEYIEREAALKTLEKSLLFCESELETGEYRKGCIAAIQDDIGNIKHLPTADVVEVKHGYWKRQKGRPEAICSECGREVVYQTIDNKWWFENYCPHCGAKMDLKEGAENAPHK